MPQLMNELPMIRRFTLASRMLIQSRSDQIIFKLSKGGGRILLIAIAWLSMDGVVFQIVSHVVSTSSSGIWSNVVIQAVAVVASNLIACTVVMSIIVV